MGVGGVVVYHGLVLFGHGDVLVRQCPTGGFNARLGSGGGSVGVEVVGVGKVGGANAACVSGNEIEGEVVDVVAAEVARVAGSEQVAEGNIAAVASVGGEIDLDKFDVGGAIVDGGDGHKGGGVGEITHHTHL